MSHDYWSASQAKTLERLHIWIHVQMVHLTLLGRWAVMHSCYLLMDHCYGTWSHAGMHIACSRSLCTCLVEVRCQ